MNEENKNYSVNCIYNSGFVMGIYDTEWCKLTGGHCLGANGCSVYLDTTEVIPYLERYRADNRKDE